MANGQSILQMPGYWRGKDIAGAHRGIRNSSGTVEVTYLKVVVPLPEGPLAEAA